MKKREAIEIVTGAAKQYRDHLCGKNLLYLYADPHGCARYFEVGFRKTNFLHLTGLKLRDSRSLHPREFYERCIDGRLSERDFDFDGDGTTQLKLDVLSRVMQKDTSARMVGEYNSYAPRLYTQRLAGGISACIGFVKGKNKYYYPNTLLKRDIRETVIQPLRVIAVFRKPMEEIKYTERTYLADKVKLSDYTFPSDIEYLKYLP